MYPELNHRLSDLECQVESLAKDLARTKQRIALLEYIFDSIVPAGSSRSLLLYARDGTCIASLTVITDVGAVKASPLVPLTTMRPYGFLVAYLQEAQNVGRITSFHIKMKEGEDRIDRISVIAPPSPDRRKVMVEVLSKLRWTLTKIWENQGGRAYMRSCWSDTASGTDADFVTASAPDPDPTEQATCGTA